MKYRRTSRQAWDSMDGKLSGELDLAILRQLRKHTPVGGVICERIEKAIGRKHQAVSGNLRHLVEDGFARATEGRGLTSSQRKAIKWVITARGEMALKVADDA
jgi:predicted transcriptional regulator